MGAEISQCIAMVVLGLLIVIGGAVSGAGHTVLAGLLSTALGAMLLVGYVRRSRRRPRARLVAGQTGATSRRSS